MSKKVYHFADYIRFCATVKISYARGCVYISLSKLSVVVVVIICICSLHPTDHGHLNIYEQFLADKHK